VRPIILLDCDGPLADFIGAYLRVVKELTGTTVSPEAVDRWHIHECAFIKNLTADARRWPDPWMTLRDRIENTIASEGFCSSIPVQPDAVHAVKRLSEIGDVYVVTSPWDSSPTWMHERDQWLKKHFGLPRDRIIQTAGKYRVHGDILVDDKPGHVRAWQEAWPGSLGILFDMPNNRNESASGLARGGWMFVLEAARERARHG